MIQATSTYARATAPARNFYKSTSFAQTQSKCLLLFKSLFLVKISAVKKLLKNGSEENDDFVQIKCEIIFLPWLPTYGFGVFAKTFSSKT
jgi:hypothetical protein